MPPRRRPPPRGDASRGREAFGDFGETERSSLANWCEHERDVTSFAGERAQYLRQCGRSLDAEHFVVGAVAPLEGVRGSDTLVAVGDDHQDERRRHAGIIANSRNATHGQPKNSAPAARRVPRSGLVP